MQENQSKIFGETVKSISELTDFNQPRVIISGFPYDEGTRRNGGRIGGAIASKIFRETLSKIEIYAQNVNVYDSGDIEQDLELEIAHQKLTQKQAQILKQNSSRGLLFSIGGSNDQSYPNVSALMQCYPDKKIGVINIDSHFDVRPLKEGKAHSGSPFRLMLEDPRFQKSTFIQFASKGATCSNIHYQYLKSHGCQVYWMEQTIRKFKLDEESPYKTQGGQLFNQIITKLSQQVDIIFVSFDVDSINSKWMPGVSAPSVLGGLTNEEALEIIKISGLCHKVRLVDFSQFNPAVESFLSSHLLVELFYELCLCFNSRFN